MRVMNRIKGAAVNPDLSQFDPFLFSARKIDI
jgi:hypothetical protein